MNNNKVRCYFCGERNPHLIKYSPMEKHGAFVWTCRDCRTEAAEGKHGEENLRKKRPRPVDDGRIGRVIII